MKRYHSPPSNPGNPNPPQASPPVSVAEAPAIDYVTLQKRKEYTFWGVVGGGILAVLLFGYIAYSQVIRPRVEELERLKSQVRAARSELQQKTEMKESLPFIKELHAAMQTQWEIGQKWFFQDYWEVLDNYLTKFIDGMTLNGIHPFCVEDDPWFKFDVPGERGVLTFPAHWTSEKMREYAEIWWQALGRQERGRARVTAQGPRLAGGNLLNPIGFEAKVCGEYQEIMDFLEYLFYESPYFFGVISLEMKKAREIRGFYQVIGVEEEVKIRGAAFWLNPEGAPNPSFLPGQMATGVGGAGPIMAGGGPAGGVGM